MGTLALLNSTIYEINIIIKIFLNAVQLFPIFSDYIKSWRVTCCEMTFFFKMFKLNDKIMKNKDFDKQLGRLQATRQVL